MIIVSPEIGPFFEKMMRDFESEKDPSKCLATNKAEVKLVENQHSEVLVRGFTVIQDEPQSVMGGGRRPTPTNYIVASVGFCENVIFARNAAVTGLSVESLETSVIRK